MRRYTMSAISLWRVILTGSSLLVAGVVLLALLWLLSCALGAPTIAQASVGVIRVATTGSDVPGCGSIAIPCRTVQYAVDVAQPGDEIRVATGVYTGVQARAGVTQVVYINKTVTVRGGYTTADWDTFSPELNRTTLDAQGLGRVLYITGDVTPTLEGLRLTGGDATGLPSHVVRDAGGGVYVYTATATISGCVIYSNIASTADAAYGGGLFLENSATRLVGNTVVSNTASTAGWGNGGGLYMGHSDAALEGNTVQGNTASTTDSGSGGGLYLYCSDATLENNMAQGNIASTAWYGYGGGLYLYDGAAILEDNTVFSNTASTASEGGGGGVFVMDGAATLRRNTIISNVASISDEGDGGGVYLYSDAATLEGNTVQGNIASTGEWGSGGGLYLRHSTARLEGNTVASNTASTAWGGNGGGLYLYGSDAALEGNTVARNIASTALLGRGGGVSLYSSGATLQGNTVRDNTGSTVNAGFGGGLYLSDSPADFIDNVIQNNIASAAQYGSGGGLNLSYSGATFEGNTIVSNTATLNPAVVAKGGGMSVWSSSPLTLTNNLIAGNHANTEGSGLWFEGSSGGSTSGRLLHTTIADNAVSGDSGQGVYVGISTTLAFTNTIVAGHSSVGITVTAGSTVALEATLWHGNGMNTDGGGAILTGTVNVYSEPAFVNPTAWNYHLGISSAAIDEGVGAGVMVDIDGDPRPQGAGYDIGADELVPWHICLPLILR